MIDYFVVGVARLNAMLNVIVWTEGISICTVKWPVVIIIRRQWYPKTALMKESGAVGRVSSYSVI